MENKNEFNFKLLLKNVRAFVFDVDGVLSKSVIMIEKSGKMMRTTNVKDGFAIKHAINNGFKIGIITGGLNPAVEKRFNFIGVEDFYLGSRNKVDDIKDFAAKHNISLNEILYMGDDMPDYDVMQIAGVPVCPADACPEIKKISLYISPQIGGEACVRDVIEQVMRVQEVWI
jgi:3-deoxy-D-manno-octulosonate 8-phosphate phosphatase (KDO 8-P phosphatase)